MKIELSERDKQVAQRLRFFREQHLKISRTSFALAIGIGSERLASYEAGRVPLRYEIFALITKRFNLRPFWLATGTSAILDDLPFDDSSFHSEIDPKKRFIEVYDLVLSEPLAREKYDRQIQTRRIKWAIDGFIATIPPGRVFVPENPVSVADLAVSARTLLRCLEESMQHAKDLPKQKALTAAYVERKFEAVKSPMKDLLSRVSLATKARGRKVALAKFLNVPQPRVSEWIHGNGEPSGENALRLLEWVTAEEAQQKESPRDAVIAARGVTRSN